MHTMYMRVSLRESAWQNAFNSVSSKFGAKQNLATARDGVQRQVVIVGIVHMHRLGHEHAWIASQGNLQAPLHRSQENNHRRSRTQALSSFCRETRQVRQAEWQKAYVGGFPGRRAAPSGPCR